MMAPRQCDAIGSTAEVDDLPGYFLCRCRLDQPWRFPYPEQAFSTRHANASFLRPGATRRRLMGWKGRTALEGLASAGLVPAIRARGACASICSTSGAERRRQYSTASRNAAPPTRLTTLVSRPATQVTHLHAVESRANAFASHHLAIQSRRRAKTSQITTIFNLFAKWIRRRIPCFAPDNSLFPPTERYNQ